VHFWNNLNQIHSISIGYQGYDDLKRFAIAVVRRLANGSKSLQVGLITFADEAEFQFKLNTFPSANEIIKAIDKINKIQT
jgi:hypothetical protein